MTILFATVAISIAGPDKDTVLAKEKAAWQAFKDKKSDDFKKLLSADFRGVYSDGIETLQKELEKTVARTNERKMATKNLEGSRSRPVKF